MFTVSRRFGIISAYLHVMNFMSEISFLFTQMNTELTDGRGGSFKVCDMLFVLETTHAVK